MASETANCDRRFDHFPRLPSDIRIIIWRYALLNEEPQIVEIGECAQDHTQKPCHEGSTRCFQPQKYHRCCTHLARKDQESCECFLPESLLSTRRDKNACSCFQDSVRKPYRFDRQSFLPGQRRRKPQCGHTGTQSHYHTIHGHVHAANYRRHLHRLPSSQLSPLFSTNREARYEVVTFGNIGFSLKESESLPAVSSQIVFKHGIDTIAIELSCLLGLSEIGKLQGVEKITSMIIFQSVSSDHSGWNVLLAKALHPFSGLEHLQLAIPAPREARYQEFICSEDGDYRMSYARTPASSRTNGEDAHSLIESVRRTKISLTKDSREFYPRLSRTQYSKEYAKKRVSELVVFPLERYVDENFALSLTDNSRYPMRQLDWVRQRLGGQLIPSIEVVFSERKNDIEPTVRAHAMYRFHDLNEELLHSSLGFCWWDDLTSVQRMAKELSGEGFEHDRNQEMRMEVAGIKKPWAALMHDEDENEDYSDTD